MGFEVIFRQQVDSIPVAELVKSRAIRVMTRPDGIDIILFHRHKILNRLLQAYHTPCQAAELVAVHSLKDNPLPVQTHQSVFYLKTAKAGFLGYHLRAIPFRVIHLQSEFIQIRLFRTP